MSLTCGFYNSLNHDRMYDARDFSRIFDGIINDGIFANIGDCFVVEALDTNIVNVGTGRAWFNGTWTLNDSLFPVTLPDSAIGYNRYDAVVLEVDTNDATRNNSIRVIIGEPSTSQPSYPELINDDGLYQHVLCYIYRKSGVDAVRQADITNMVGTDETPFVTGILQVTSLDKLLGQWRDELNRFVEMEENDIDEWFRDHEAQFNLWVELHRTEYEEWVKQYKTEYTEFLEETEQDLADWLVDNKGTFKAWFDDLVVTLDENVAAKLEMEIQKEEVKRILTSGFEEGTKVFSDDGTVITMTASDGKKLVKTFTNEFSTLTTEFISAQGGIIATQVKEFDPDGKLITTTIEYI